jgi:hypothetical protein
MDLNIGPRTTAAAGAAVLLGGLSIVLYGILRNDLARSVGGGCVAIAALALIALVIIRRWIVDTQAERLVLSEARRKADAEGVRYFALEAALENERGRLTRDMAAERAALVVRMKAERDALETEFEERRAAIIVQTMEDIVLMMRSGKFAPEASAPGNLIQFPDQQRERTEERSRERHGVSGP